MVVCRSHGKHKLNEDFDSEGPSQQLQLLYNIWTHDNIQAASDILQE